MYSPGDSSEGEEEPTLSRAPPIRPNLARQQSSSKYQTYGNIIKTNFKSYNSFERFSPSINHPFNGLSVPNNKIANNSSTEHEPSVGYGHRVSPTSHGTIFSSGNILTTTTTFRKN